MKLLKEIHNTLTEQKLKSRVLQKELEETFPVRKDMGSIRAKGVAIEEIVSYAIEKFNMKYVGSFHGGTVVPTTETLYMSKDKQHGAWQFSASMGIPSGILGFKTKEEWLKFRSELREEGLVR